MIFSEPLFLLLLLVIPLVIYWGFPRIAFRKTRDTISLVLRVIMMCCLVAGLAGLQLAQASDRLAVVFLLDHSDSMDVQAREAQLDYVREALNAMPPDDQAAIVVFGASALVDRPLNTTREVTTIRSIPQGTQTHLESAIALGLALFPEDSARRMVILSDGVETLGNAVDMAQRASNLGVEISYVPLSSTLDVADIRVSDVRVPASVEQNQQFDLSFTVTSDEATNATLNLIADGTLLSSERVQLEQGANHYALTLESGNTGFSNFQVQVIPTEADRFNQNNHLSTFSRVIGPSRVLVVAVDAQESQAIADALEEQGMGVTQITPSAIPNTLNQLESYDSVILTNVPATRLPTSRLNLLQQYVRDLGGSLIVSGGPNSYAPGGYYQTALEEMLPLDMQIRDQQRIPRLTISYVIDRSGSMTSLSPNRIPIIELAKEAILRSLELLQANDRAGVVSFDTGGTWIVPLQNVDDRRRLQMLVGSIEASGGTDIGAGLRLAAEGMREETSERKHIILLTDGGASPEGLAALASDLYQNYNTTLSVIALGSQIPPFLSQLATAGGGNYHQITDADLIPTIFTQEAILATRSYIIEEEFTPSISGISPIMEGITSAPSLTGYVATTAKPTGLVVLAGPEPFRDPILAQWQYGLGRVVAFTSDATARWGTNWVEWDQFGRFWSQVVQWSIIENATANLETHIEYVGESAFLIVDARTDDDAFLNGLTLQARVVTPNTSEEAQRLTLSQVAPGRYQAEFIPSEEGVYLYHVSGEGVPPNSDEVVSYTDNNGWVLNYSAEYIPMANPQAGIERLHEIATLTNGQSLAGDAALVFAHNLSVQNALSPLWPLFILIAILLLPLDIAIRRLLITRSDLDRVRQRFSREPQIDQDAAQRRSTLLDAKTRAQQRTQGDAPTVSGPPLSKKPTSPTPAPKPTSIDAPASPPSTGDNLAGQLLKRRRDHRE